MSVINARNLTKRYGRRVGIVGIDLEVPVGVIFGFLGPNGAGKSTTIRILLGFLRPQTGQSEILGQDCWRKSHLVKRQVGYVPGDLRLYPWLTAAGALAIVGRVRGLDLKSAGAELCERFRLDPSVKVRSMSRGMRQKLGLIMALAPDPPLLILDEPTSGLDPIMQQTLAQLLRDRADQGRTVFFSSHTLSEVDQLCDRVGIVREGRLIANESLQDLRSRARREVRIEFADREAAAQATAPSFLKVHERSLLVWNAELVGQAPRLVEWAASQSLQDISLGPPDLESFFHRFYQESEGPESEGQS